MGRKIWLLIILVFSLAFSSESQANGNLDDWMRKDTVKISRDSLLKIIHLKDSLLLQASLDSLAMSNLLEVLWWEKDSVQQELQNLHFHLRLDTIYQSRLDSLLVERNRVARWDIRDSIFRIEDDSVRFTLGTLLDNTFQDSANIPDLQTLKHTWKNLIYHLANDSTYFWIHYGQQDSVSVVLKNNAQVRNAIFLTNQQADSAKVYLRGEGKHSLHMWVDDNLFLQRVLKRTNGLDSIQAPDRQASMVSIPKRKVPVGKPKYWKADGKMDLTLSQYAYHHWAKGGNNQMTFLYTSSGFANYNKGKLSWNNNYNYRYGMIKLEDVKFFKNSDVMKAKSILKHKAFGNFAYNASFNFDGQLFEGFRSVNDTVAVSKFLAPATVFLGVGLTYQPNKVISANFQPISQKFKIVADTVNIDPTRYGLAGDQWIKGNPGAKLTVTYKKLLWKTLNTSSVITLFSNYDTFFTVLDYMDWTTNLSVKVNKYISTKFYIRLVYDDYVLIPLYEKNQDGEKIKVGEDKRVQIMENFGITFTYLL